MAELKRSYVREVSLKDIRSFEEFMPRWADELYANKSVSLLCAHQLCERTWHARDAEVEEKDREIEAQKKIYSQYRGDARQKFAEDAIELERAEAQVSELREMVRQLNTSLQGAIDRCKNNGHLVWCKQCNLDSELCDRATKLLQPQDMTK